MKVSVKKSPILLSVGVDDWLKLKVRVFVGVGGSDRGVVDAVDVRRRNLCAIWQRGVVVDSDRCGKIGDGGVIVNAGGVGGVRVGDGGVMVIVGMTMDGVGGIGVGGEGVWEGGVFVVSKVRGSGGRSGRVLVSGRVV